MAANPSMANLIPGTRAAVCLTQRIFSMGKQWKLWTRRRASHFQETSYRRYNRDSQSPRYPNAYPVPNLTTPLPNGNNWFFSAQHPQYQRTDTLSLDANLMEKQRLRLRHVYFTFWEYQPLDGGTNETPKYFDRPNQTYSLDHVWTSARRR